MKKIQQVIGEKLTREVSQLMRSPIGQNRAGDEKTSGLTLEALVGEATAEAFVACFKNIGEYLKQNEKTFRSWKELYAGMIEGWMDYCKFAALNSRSERMDSQYVASRVIAASLLLQIGKEDTSYAQICDAWAHRSTSQPPGRKQFRDAMTNWINAKTEDVMLEVRRLQEEFVDRESS
jgi:hypothetical protein